MITFILIGAALLLIGFYVVSIYNQLVKARIIVQEAWSGVGTFLQQRNDVIPNMVEIVKGYAGHENATLVEVTKWRNRSAQASTPTEQNEASNGLGKAMLDFYQVTEQYPDLKANENFLKLQQDLGDLEEKINQSRRYYNGTVRDYNQSIAVFPKVLVANSFGFNSETFFKEDASAQTAPKISF
ncbi:MAG: LemA family protein [Chitinophagaceae bacterium]|nr:LemA family protein [Chitinophagaceae bacterium]